MIIIRINESYQIQIDSVKKQILQDLYNISNNNDYDDDNNNNNSKNNNNNMNNNNYYNNQHAIYTKSVR